MGMLGNTGFDKVVNTHMDSLYKKIMIPSRNRSTADYAAVDLGNMSVKVVIGNYKKKKIYIKEAFEIPLFEGKRVIERKPKPEDYVRCLARIKRLCKAKKLNLVCTIQSRDILQHKMTVPRLSHKELKKTIEYEVGQQMQVDMSIYGVQYKVTEQSVDKKDRKNKVQVSAMPKTLIRDYEELIKDARCKAAALDINVNSLEKLLQAESIYNPALANQNIVMIDMGYTQFNIAFFTNGSYLFNRMTSIGYKDLEQAILRNLDGDLDETQRIQNEELPNISLADLYKAYGRVANAEDFTEDKGEMILRAIVEIMENWADTIEDVIKYYIARDGKFSVDQIWIYGGCSFLKEMDEYLEERLGITTKKVSQMDCVQAKPEVVKQSLANYLNVIGALIRVS